MTLEGTVRRLVVGVDIGTTTVKAAGFDPGGAMHSRVEARYELHEPQPGWVEQDPLAVLDAVVGLVPKTGPVALSSAMHSLVGLDARDRPVTALITWGDTRASAQAERLRADHPELHARTGTPLHPMSPLAKLCWLRENGVQAHRWAGVKELVVHRLTGEWAMDHSTASGTGLMDLATLDWDPEALAVAGVTPDQLPRLVPVTERFGELVVGAGDGPLANLGVGAVEPGVAACSIGTSGALRLMVSEPAIDPAGRSFCYALTPGHWVVGGAINNGGVVLDWLSRTFAAPVETLLKEAGRVPAGSDGLVMLPYLLSERAPHWSTGVHGAYVGLARRHGRGHLVRAGLEGVCQQLALVLASLVEAGYEVGEIRATGGFSRSALWKQILADALGIPLGFTRGREGSAFGAALLGMQALGIVDSIERAAGLIEVSETVEPAPEAAAVYVEQRPRFEDLYRRLT